MKFQILQIGLHVVDLGRIGGETMGWFLEFGERLEGLEVSMELFTRETIMDLQVQVFYLNLLIKMMEFPQC